MAWSVRNTFALACVWSLSACMLYVGSRYFAASPVQIFKFRRTFEEYGDLYWPAERQQEQYGMNTEESSVAVGGGIRLHKCAGLTHDTAATVLKSEPIVADLIPTFCATASPGYVYYLYFAYDYNDPCLNNDDNVEIVAQYVYSELIRTCYADVDVRRPRFIRCPYSGKPAWAQNEAMMAAYWHNVSYFYRVNDDTKMVTPGWTEAFISQLNSFTPPKVGVVGPKHSGGNTRILTLDFTHRTHVDIFGYYYPSEFPDWYADSWITHAYDRNKRMKKVENIKLVHTQKAGTRYKHTSKKASFIKLMRKQGGEKITKWMDHKHYLQQHAGSKGVPCSKVVSFTFTNTSMPQFLKALRILVTVNTLLPSSRWCSRVYVPQNIDSSYTDIMERYGAQVYRVTPETASTTPICNGSSVTTSLEPHQWHYLAMLDTAIKIAVVKPSMKEISFDTARNILEWEESQPPIFYGNVYTDASIEGVKMKYIHDAVQNKTLKFDNFGTKHWLRQTNISSVYMSTVKYTSDHNNNGTTVIT